MVKKKVYKFRRFKYGPLEEGSGPHGIGVQFPDGRFVTVNDEGYMIARDFPKNLDKLTWKIEWIDE